MRQISSGVTTNGITIDVIYSSTKASQLQVSTEILCIKLGAAVAGVRGKNGGQKTFPYCSR